MRRKDLIAASFDDLTSSLLSQRLLKRRLRSCHRMWAHTVFITEPPCRAAADPREQSELGSTEMNPDIALKLGLGIPTARDDSVNGVELASHSETLSCLYPDVLSLPEARHHA